MLVIEALFHNLHEQKISPDTMLQLSCRNRLGSIVIKIGFEGKLAYLYSMEDGEVSPEDHILQAYEDKISHSYYSGYNSFQISVKRKHCNFFWAVRSGASARFLSICLCTFCCL